MKEIKRKYTLEQIEELVNKSVHWWKWDSTEGVYVNKWSIANSKQYGIPYKPEFDTQKQAKDFFRNYLKQHFLKQE